MNPWPMIGGVANVMCMESEFIRPNHGKAGDVLVLTKPLGTQPAVNMKQRLSKEDGEAFFAERGIESERIEHAYFMAMESMATLNRNAAMLMRKYSSHGATDVTGFGILGHAENLAAAQISKVDIVIRSLPIISEMDSQV